MIPYRVIVPYVDIPFYRKNLWLDEQTRVIFIEFAIYNVNTALFTTVTLTFELPTLGGIFMWKQIDSVQLYRYTGGYTIQQYYLLILPGSFIYS